MAGANTPSRRRQPRLPSAPRDQNACLSALPAEALALLTPHLSRTALDYNTVLWDAGKPNNSVYFPLSGLISIVLPMSTGEKVEVATVSHQGAAGAILSPGRDEPLTRGMIQIGGVFAHIDADRLREIAAQNPVVERMLDLCRDWIAVQAQQAAACNTVHDAPKRLARWLAHNAQKMETGTLLITQDMLGSLLGIRRTTVTLIAQDLHKHGLIDYSRGRIRVTAPGRLEAAACECCRMLGHSHWPATRLGTGPSNPAGE